MTAFPTSPAGAAFRGLLGRARRRMATSRGRRILHALSDGNLKDIGSARGSIDRVLREGRAGRQG